MTTKQSLTAAATEILERHGWRVLDDGREDGLVQIGHEQEGPMLARIDELNAAAGLEDYESWCERWSPRAD